MRKRNNLLREVFFWLFIFVIGSLIVTFIFYPGSFQFFKSNMEIKINDLSSQDKISDISDRQDTQADLANLTKLEIGLSCSEFKTFANMRGLAHNLVAMELCPHVELVNQKEYYGYECISKGYFYCLYIED